MWTVQGIGSRYRNKTFLKTQKRRKSQTPTKKEIKRVENIVSFKQRQYMDIV